MRVVLVCPHGELDRDVVEAADDSARLRERISVHPGDAEVPRVGETGPGLGHRHELRRDRDAYR